jgi:uncharacterized iron-regulated protein
MHYLVFLIMLLGVHKLPTGRFPADSARRDGNPQIVPHRVYDTSKSEGVDFEEMVTELTGADIVFIGEQHDNAPTHRLERAILEGLSRRNRSVILSLEMFERDVQPSLNSYLSGKMQEAEFLKVSRPWPAYESNYKPLVALASENRWPVIAANVPRKYASQVARSGLPTIDSLSAAERELFASKVACPHDQYFKRFQQQMGSHPGPRGGSSVKSVMSDDHALMERLYAAQCLKDETMAESIANAWSAAASPKPLVIHFTGAFHSDFRQGTVTRVQQRLNGRRIRVVSIIPVTNLDKTKASEQRKRADYLIFTTGSQTN